MPQDSTFRKSLYSLVRELRLLQPFLIAPNQSQVRAECLPGADPAPDNPPRVKVIARRRGSEWLVVLVNESERSQMGIEVFGLQKLNGHDLHLLYDNEVVTVKQGQLITRLRPFEVKVFATSRKWESASLEGRDFK